MAFNHRGTYLATTGLDGKICIWDVLNGALCFRYSGKSAVLSVAWLEEMDVAVLVGMRDGNMVCLIADTESVRGPF